MLRPRIRGALAAACAAIVASLLGLAGGPFGQDGLSVDTLFLLRDRGFGPRHPAATAQVALVLIDEATYDTPPFAGVPKDLWTPQFGQVIGAIAGAGPKVVGFDILLPTSLAQYQDDHDLAFQQALHEAAAAGRLVMAKFRGLSKMQLPSPIQMRIVGASNVRATNVYRDDDDIVRRIPTLLQLSGSAGGSQPSFTQEIAQRAGAPPASPAAPDLFLNFDGGYPFPTYSFSDLYACHDPAYFARQFAGKVVLIGTGLDVEDRLLTSRRFINQPELMTGDRCTPARPGAAPPRRATVPGVFVNATAVDNLIRHEGLQDVALPTKLAFIGVAALVSAAAALSLSLAPAFLSLVLLVAATSALSTALFQHAIVTPYLSALTAELAAFFLSIGYRFLIADRQGRAIRKMFSLYLAPVVIDRMVAAGRLPSLDGERREMTFFFSDIEGFTSLTESADPAVLSAVLNSYFDGVCEIIMRNGGMVIEFLGDGVQAMFGAPEHQPDHAALALAAARDVRRFAREYRSKGVPLQLGLGRTRIGIHSGEATVGNIGASTRLKYAALGDVVNSTSRLEGLNKYFGTDVCISEESRSAASDTDVRPLGDFLLKGKTKVITVYELLDVSEGGSAFAQAYLTAYRHLTAGADAAVAAFEQVVQGNPADACSAFHLERARRGVLSPVIEMLDK